MAGRALRAAEHYFIRQDKQDFMDSNILKTGSIQIFRCIGISSLLMYSLDTTLDPQIAQIPQMLYRKYIRDRSKVAWRSYLG
jgi:hypothetical protein